MVTAPKASVARALTRVLAEKPASASRNVPPDYGELRRRGKPGLASSWEIDVAGDCLSPVPRERVGREWREQGGKAVHSIVYQCPCRKCANCLKRRGAHWRFRAKAEHAAASRTWFGTLTFSPEKQVEFLNRARLFWVAGKDRAGKTVPVLNPKDFDTLTADQQFGLLCKFAGREVQLYLKRVRKGGIIPVDSPHHIDHGKRKGLHREDRHDSVRLRYFLVWEAHKSGLPHAHILVHETGTEIKHRWLKYNFTAGFCDFKLALEERQITYLCKYLTKSMSARVRASIDYGQMEQISPSIALSIGADKQRRATTTHPQVLPAGDCSSRGVTSNGDTLTAGGVPREEAGSSLTRNAGE